MPLIRHLLQTIISDHELVLSPQTLNECYAVLSRAGLAIPRQAARDYVFGLSRHCTGYRGEAVTFHAWQIQDETGYQWWDALLLASAQLSGCDVFLSEDLQHGRRIGSLRILNPFVPDTSSIFSV